MDTTTPSNTPTTGEKVKKTAKKVALLSLLFLILLGGIYAFRNVIVNSVMGCYSEGSRTGQIAKFSKKGVMFKTYEGELLNRGLAVGGTGDTWLFSVEDENVAKSLEQAMLKGHRVVLHYCEHQRVVEWQGETKYFVTRVESTQE